MPYVIGRSPYGMLNNVPTIRKSVKKMSTDDRMSKDGTFDNLSIREKRQITRQCAKLEKMIGSIADMGRLPAALFVVDVLKEHIAISEAKRLGIPVFAMVDTNSDPSNVDFVIPANDDATKSVEIIVTALCDAINEGLQESKARDKEESERASDEADDEKDNNTRRDRRAKSNARRPKKDEPASEPQPAAPETAPEAPEAAPESTPQE